MLVLLREDASVTDEERVVELIETLGARAHRIPDLARRAVAVVGHDGRLDPARFAALPGVEEIVPLTKPYRMVSKSWRPTATVVPLGGGVTIGGNEIFVAAGPCSVESEEQLLAAARSVKQSGAVALRAGAYKPRSSPYAFQGLGAPALEILARARRETGLLIVTEAFDDASIEAVSEVADMIQIGARNMQNFGLLKRAGRLGKPVLLKRGPTATVADWLLSAEYLLAEGNPNVVLCERGIKGWDPSARNVFDLNVIPILEQRTHLPVIADPSHGTGSRVLVRPMARAAIAAGADGLLIEVHPEPDRALSDGAQSLYPEQFEVLMEEVRSVAEAIGRGLPAVSVTAT